MHIVIGACHRHREGEKLRKVTLAAFIYGAMDWTRKSRAQPMEDYSDALPPSPPVGVTGTHNKKTAAQISPAGIEMEPQPRCS
jgi:hypothetical protein